MTREATRPSPAVFALAVLGGLFALAAAAELTAGLFAFGWDAAIGVDLDIYLDATARLLSGGGWYLDRQLHGPYLVEMGDVLYPPVTALVFAPFLVIPQIVWWVIPIAVTAWVVIGFRPAPWTWPLMTVGLMAPISLLKVVSGNPALWIMAAVALGLRLGWPGALVLLKPSLLPLALGGVRSRGWWIAAALIALASVPFLAQTLAYPRVVLDARHDLGFLYSIHDLPLVLLPVIARVGRRA